MIYVDELFAYPQKPKPGSERFFGNGKSSCHMSTDDMSPDGLEALHQFAAELGMRRAWFQDDAVFPHYDLVPGQRERALAKGAKAVTAFEFIEICKRPE